jgi:superfamily II DNA/RNA helicase
VNYQCTDDEKTYLHRIGRTGRAGHTGVAVTLVDWDDMPRWGLIDKTLAIGIPEPQETYSSSDHFFSDLGIPEGTKGTLPRSMRTREGLNAERVEDLGETGKHAGGSRGPRDSGRGSRSGRDGGHPRAGERPAARSDERPGEAAERTPRQRNRRRTHGGTTAEAGTAMTGEPSSSDPAATSDTSTDGAPRRRRRRGGRGRGGASQAGTPAAATQE